MSRLEARKAITPTDQSPIFLIVTWISQATVLLAVIVKVLLSHTSTGVHADDWCILVAAALSIVQVVAASFQGVNGTGMVQASLSHHQLDVYEKAAYIAEILSVLSLVVSKLSVLLFLFHITPFKLWRRTTTLVGLFTAAWGLSSVFVVAFQCQGPKKWDILRGQCIDQTAFWTAYSAFNIAIELALIAVPFTMFSVLISSTYNKIILMLCFSLRFSVVAVAILQLYYLHHPAHPSKSSTFDSSDDYTFSTWPVFLTAQIIQSLSIITTCVPFMRTLFLGLETGMIQTGHVSRRRVSAAVKSRWKDRPNNSSGHSSASRSNPISPTNASLQLSSWRFNANESVSTPLLDPSQTANDSMVDTAFRSSSNASSVTESTRSSRELVLTRQNSGSASETPRTLTAPAPARRGSGRPQRPVLEHSLSRRQVSMIVEEDEEPHRNHILWAIPDTRPALSGRREIERPQPALDVGIPTGRIPSSVAE